MCWIIRFRKLPKVSVSNKKANEFYAKIPYVNPLHDKLKFNIHHLVENYMHLPTALQAAIEKEIEFHGLKNLITAREDLTERYRQGSSKSLIQTDAHRLSYVIARLPATYAAVYKVLLAIKERAPTLQIRSLLDLGAGPGTAMWAALDCFPEIEKVTLMEQDNALAQFGKRLATTGPHPAFKSAAWHSVNLEQSTQLPVHDLVIFSYSIGEILPAKIAPLIQQSWQATEQLFVVIEPGTPVGFERIRSIRSQLIESGGHLVAPCPHEMKCPMSDGDWCHFAARIERSSTHRLLKSGTLGYEDEKFSYIAATKESYPFPKSRVLRHPLQRSGHVILTLCTKDGIQRPTISKRTPAAYKEAKHVDWGSVFSFGNDANEDGAQ